MIGKNAFTGDKLAGKLSTYAKLVRNLICGQILVRNWVSGFALDPIPYKNLPATAVSNYNLATCRALQITVFRMIPCLT